MNQNEQPRAAGEAAQVTEAQVVAFFKSKLADFQARMPGYASIKLDVSRHECTEFLVEWEAYHNDTGHCDEACGHSVECAVAWHFGPEVTRMKIKRLREKAAEANRRADEFEAGLAIPPPPNP